jgi:hypothetical protein
LWTHPPNNDNESFKPNGSAFKHWVQMCGIHVLKNPTIPQKISKKMDNEKKLTLEILNLQCLGLTMHLKIP